MYNEDADRVSEAVGINKAHADKNEFTYTAFSARKLNDYLPALIRKGYVAIWRYVLNKGSGGETPTQITNNN